MSFVRKISYILDLIKTTPGFGWIILTQLCSAFLSVLGLPLLVPVLDYMAGKEINASLFNLFKSFTGATPSFHALLLLAVGLILGGYVCVALANLIAANAQASLLERYRKSIFNAYSHAQWLWLIDNRSGEINHAILKESEIASVAHLNAQRVLINFIQIIVLLFVAIKLSLPVTLMAIVVYTLLAFISVFNASRILKLAQHYNQRLKTLANDLNIFQRNKKFFKTSLLNKNFIEEVFINLKDITCITVKQNMRIEFQAILSSSVAVLFLGFLMFFSANLNLTYSVLILILFIFMRISPQFSALSTAYATLDSNIPMHQSLQERLSQLHRYVEDNGRELWKNGDIVFDHVVFNYPNGNIVFKDLNVVIKKSQITAFVGESGSGKSTLLDLILGLIKPSAGKIIYNGVAHDAIDKDSLRSQIAYVPQETTLVDGSIRDNLMLQDIVDDKTIIEVFYKVGLAGLLASLPEGLSAPIGENGIKFSGGQRQRLALARALLMKPEILILDEATSSLDVESERLVLETIDNLKKDYTIIMVTHKLSAVKLADTIYVLEQGNIAESGSFQMLLDKNGKFFNMHRLQNSVK